MVNCWELFPVIRDNPNAKLWLSRILSAIKAGRLVLQEENMNNEDVCQVIRVCTSHVR